MTLRITLQIAIGSIYDTVLVAKTYNAVVVFKVEKGSVVKEGGRIEKIIIL